MAFIPDEPTTPTTGFIPDEPLKTGGFIPEFSKGLVRGSLNVGAATVGTSKAATEALRKIPTWNLLFTGIERITGKTFEQEQKEAKQRIQKAAQKFPVTHRGAAAWGGRILGEAIPYMGAALAGGYVAGLPGAAIVGFSVEGDNAYDSAKAAGASEKRAQAERVVVGSINAALEALQINKLMKFHAAGKGSIRGLVTSVRGKMWKMAKQQAKNLTGQTLRLALEEGIQESLQEGVSFSAEALRGDYPKRPDGSPDIIAIGQRLGEATLGGAVAGGILGGAGAAIGATPDIARPTDVDITSTCQRIEQSGLPQHEKNLLIKQVESLRETPTDEALPEPDEVTKKLATAIEQVEVLRPAEKEAISKERGKRFGEYEEILKDTENPVVAAQIATRALAGALKIEITPAQMSEIDINTLYDRVRQSTIVSGEKLSVFEGLNKLFAIGKYKTAARIPARHEIEAMESVFGTDVVQALLAKRKQAGKAGWDKIIAAINLPRAILASYDLSAPGRQGLLLFPLVPGKWLKSLGVQIKAFVSPEYANYMDLQIKTDPYYQSATRAGLNLTRIGGMWGTEEMFMSEYSNRIPGIPASERAYVTNLNYLRFQTFKHFAQQWEGSGKSIKDYKDLAKFINHATGRGDIKKLKKFMSTLNALFFAPRLQMGRVQAIGDLFTSTSAVRKLVAADLLKFVGGGLLILTLLNMLKGVEVEPNPISSDFGKIRIGNTRIDFWAGYQQIARYIAQLIAGHIKATETGRIMPVERGDIIWRFIQSKLSPPAGLTVDLLRGETFLGKQLEMEPEIVAEQIQERLTPLFIQDLTDAIRYQGLNGAAVVAPLALHGVGAMTYPVTASSESARAKDVYAQKYFGRKWDKLGPEPQRALRAYVPQISLAEEKAKTERENYDFIAKMKEEQAAAGRKIENNLSKSVKTELNRLIIHVGGLSKHIGTNWYLNPKRYKQYQSDTQNILNKILPKIINNRMWKTLPDEVQREVLKSFIDEAKKTARLKIIQQATINDLQHTEQLQ